MCSRIPSRRSASSRRPHRGRPQRRPPLPPGKADRSPGQDILSRWLALAWPRTGRGARCDHPTPARRWYGATCTVVAACGANRPCALSPTRVRRWSPPARWVRWRCGWPALYAKACIGGRRGVRRDRRRDPRTLHRTGPPRGTLVTIAEPVTVYPRNGRAVFFVVESDRARLADLAQRLRDGRLKPIVGAVRPLAEAASVFTPDKRTPDKTIIRVTEG